MEIPTLNKKIDPPGLSYYDLNTRLNQKKVWNRYAAGEKLVPTYNEIKVKFELPIRYSNKDITELKKIREIINQSIVKDLIIILIVLSLVGILIYFN